MADVERNKDRSREGVRRERPSRFTSDKSRDRSLDRSRGTNKGVNRVFVSNIPYEFRWQDLKDLFRNKVGEVQYVELFLDDNDKSRGCGVVDFPDVDGMKKCLEVMQRYEIKGRQLVVKEDGGNSRDKSGRVVGPGGKKNRDDLRQRDNFINDQPPSGPNIVLGDLKWGNTFGLSPSFLESLQIDPPLCNRVFVANLEYNVDKKKLKEVFRLAGKVQRVDLHTDKDGRSRGFAVIEFDHPVEAVQAISMFNNQMLFDRVMTVRLDRASDSSKLPDGLKSVGMGLGTNGQPLRDVSNNLPSLNTNATTATANVGSVGAGLLGAVPNSAYQVASALSGLNSLQASINTLLSGGGGGGGGDLTSLVSNPVIQGQVAMSALVGNSALSSSLSNANVSNFGRSDNQTSGFNANQNFPGQNFGSRPFGGGGGQQASFGSFGNDRDNFSTRNQSLNQGNASQGGRFSSNNKLLITNLPASASYKMLHEKLGEFGEVQHMEEKGNGGMLVVYSSDWQAERAIKNLDRARIDGRTIEARLYY